MADASKDPGTPGPESDAPVFLVGWWRSGTTFFWNLLRDDDRYTCYFEPLHEHLPVYLDIAPVPETDPTHLDVASYWREYRHVLDERLDEQWAPWFGRDRWVLSPEEEAPKLRDHLDLLIGSAPGRPVFKLVRGSFRTAWLRETYPDATIVHIVRDPRCVWTSMVGRDAGSDDPIPVERHGFFHAMLRIADELGLGTDEHLYRLFYRVWVRAYRSVEAVADLTWWYDDAVREPDAWLGTHLVEAGWLDETPDVEVHADSLDPGLHPKTWYLAHEAAATEPDPAKGDDDPRVAFLLEENRHLDDELERMYRLHERLERKYDRLLAHPSLRTLVRLYHRFRAAIGRPVD